MAIDFPRVARLLTAEDYRQVFDTATYKVQNQEFLILATPTPIEESRVGLVIAKKNIKLAVQRNRIKRIIRESFRHSRTQLNDLDLVVMARRGASDMDNAKLREILDKLLLKLRRKHDSSGEQK
jgi:ribonuclease P protein component